MITIRQQKVLELNNLGIKDIQFFKYSEEYDSFSKTHFSNNPESSEEKLIKKLESNNWERISNDNYPEFEIKENHPYYSKPIIYQLNNWKCFIFKRFGFDLDGLFIKFEKVKKYYLIQTYLDTSM